MMKTLKTGILFTFFLSLITSAASAKSFTCRTLDRDTLISPKSFQLTQLSEVEARMDGMTTSSGKIRKRPLFGEFAIFPTNGEPGGLTLYFTAKLGKFTVGYKVIAFKSSNGRVFKGSIRMPKPDYDVGISCREKAL